MAKTEVDYIESAYADAIGVIFKQLFTGLDTQLNENELTAHFSTGFAAAKKAKELALGIVKPAAILTANVAQSRRRKPPAS
jgi:hypothetical protein